MKKQVAAVKCLGLAAVLVLAGSVMGQDKPPAQQSDDTAKQQQNKQSASANQESAGKGRAYLGAAVGPVHPSMRSQLTQPDGRGVLVAEVAKDSPAQKAGLKADDILVSFNDQQLYAPEQLVRLVQNDKPGQEVTVGVLRSGKEEKIKVTLGERPATMPEPRRQPSFPPAGSLPPVARPSDRASAWERFDSLTLTRMDNNRFKAEISYRNESGQVEHKKFEGTRDEIRRDLEKQKDMPASERDHLLRALDMRPPFPGAALPRLFNPDGRIFWDSDLLDRDCNR